MYDTKKPNSKLTVGLFILVSIYYNTIALFAWLYALLPTQQLSFNQIEVEYKSYLKKGLIAIQNLRHLFDNTDVSGKQDIIRSTLKENGVFSEGRVRTGKLNNLILLTTYGDGEFGGDKKRKGSKICSLSGMVPEQFDLSNFISDFQCIKTLIEHKI